MLEIDHAARAAIKGISGFQQQEKVMRNIYQLKAIINELKKRHRFLYKNSTNETLSISRVISNFIISLSK